MKKDVKAFLKINRKSPQYRPVEERLADYRQVSLLRSAKDSRKQAYRCMDCGTPFCHWACPLGNYIPEWNDLMLYGRWEEAVKLLNDTNNLAEITGRVCPAPCEYSCVLGINDDPVTIRENELDIIEYGFKQGLIKPQIPQKRTGKKVAVIGSGPAGLATADQLNKAGHKVVVFEKAAKIGGILRYGIPDFKLEKKLIDRRLSLWKKEGIEFRTKVRVGQDLSVKELRDNFDALAITIGSGCPRDLKIEGRSLEGIYFAMDYLTQNNRRLGGEDISAETIIDAKDKKVVVIGGGDTGSDCVGTANRQGAKSVVQIEVMPRPDECRSDAYPWPNYPLLLKVSSSHEEGSQRHWSILTKKFIGQNNKLNKLSCIKVEFSSDSKNSCPLIQEIKGSDFEIEVDLAILAIGFLYPQPKGLVQDLNLSLDKRGNVLTDEKFMTATEGIFAAGDAHRGQSLVVQAISEGRRAALAIDTFLRK